MLWYGLMIWTSLWSSSTRPVLAAASSSFVLEGSQTSYAQFRQWHGGQNDTLSFEFGQSHRDALLLYSDNNQEKEYIQIKLVKNHIMLR